MLSRLAVPLSAAVLFVAPITAAGAVPREVEERIALVRQLEAAEDHEMLGALSRATPGQEFSSGESLCLAIERRDERLFARLLAAGVDADSGCGAGTVLEAAVESDELRWVERVLAAGGNAANPKWRSPLSTAVQRGKPEIVRRLLRAGAEPHGRVSEPRERPIVLAAQIGRPDLVVVLLDHGGAEAPDGGRALALGDFGRGVCQQEVLRALVDGVEIESHDDRGRTGLIAAVVECDPEVLDWLLDAGADVDATSDDRRTALMWAAGQPLRGEEKLRLLIERGASLELQDTQGRTALHFAVGNGPNKTRLLLDAGADPRAEDGAGRSAYHYAVLGHVARWASQLPPRGVFDEPVGEETTAAELFWEESRYSTRSRTLEIGRWAETEIAGSWLGNCGPGEARRCRLRSSEYTDASLEIRLPIEEEAEGPRKGRETRSEPSEGHAWIYEIDGVPHRVTRIARDLFGEEWVEIVVERRYESQLLTFTTRGRQLDEVPLLWSSLYVSAGLRPNQRAIREKEEVEERLFGGLRIHALLALMALVLVLVTLRGWFDRRRSRRPPSQPPPL